MQTQQDSTASSATDPPETSEDEAVQDTNSTEPVADEEPVPLDLIFGILKNGRRRRVIQYLMETEQEVTLSDLAEHIAAIENDTTPERLTSSQRKRVYVGLYQCHLPKMDDAGVIEYNQARGIIQRTPKLPEFHEYLNPATSDTDRQWYRYYAGASGLGLLPLVFGLLVPTPDIVISGLLLTVLLGISTISLYHWYTVDTDTGGWLGDMN
jgi:DNA-binding transcriptional ArsR family regulator